MSLSPLALDLLHAPPSSEDYRKAVEQAAFAPDLYAEIREHFKDGHPSDDNLRYFLVKKGFASSAIASVTRAYRASSDLCARVSQRDGGGPESPNDREALAPSPESAPAKIVDQGRQSVDAGHVERTVLSLNVSVEMRFSAPPTREDFEALSDYAQFRMKRLPA
jgi:hypothetical protein